MRIYGSPFDAYTLHWRLFRCMSNENEVFANAVLNCKLFKNSNQSTIIDVGTGDGAVIQRVIKNTNSKNFVLIDPSDEYLTIAKLLTAEYANRIRYEKIKFIEMQTYPKALYLAIHMIYLLSEKEIELLLELPFKGFDLILIVDSPESIFSQLWNVCAKDYYKKCEYFYTQLKKMHKTKNITEIKSKVLSPFKSRIDGNTRIAMLSTMCYCDWKSLSDKQKEIAQSIINNYNQNDIIDCRSNLIEIHYNN